MEDALQRRILVGLTSVAVVAAGLTALVTGADAAPPAGQQDSVNEAVGVDDLPGATEQKRRDMRMEALSDVLSGKRKAQKRGDSTVVKMGKKAAANSKNRGSTPSNCGPTRGWVNVTPSRCAWATPNEPSRNRSNTSGAARPRRTSALRAFDSGVDHRCTPRPKLSIPR